MGIYALTLSSSNVIAPIISGFINDGQGYRWVFYWPTIFLGIAFVFLFLFLEETNYERKFDAVIQTSDSSNGGIVSKKSEKEGSTNHPPAVAVGEKSFARKTFLQRLSIIDEPRPFRMFYRIKHSLQFVTWPCIFYGNYTIDPILSATR